MKQKKEGKGWRAHCPFHDDRNPSLFVYNDGFFKCFGCGATGTVVEEELEIGALTLNEFTREKQLPVQFLKQNFVREYEGGLIFFYLNEDGDTAKAIPRYRHTMHGKNRFTWERGSKPIPYGLWKLKEYDKGEPIIIVEGESDALTLWYCGIQALGVPGVQAWRAEFARFIKDFKRVFVVVEPDSKGALYKALKKNLPCKPLIFENIGYKDPSEAFISLGREQFISFIEGMIREVEENSPRIIPVKDVEARKTEWAIPFWFAKGVINLIAGEPGVGKTTLILNLIACASTGKGKVPIGDEFITVPSCKVLYVSLEDDLMRKIKPILDAIGVGDCDNIYLSYAEGKRELNEISKEFKFFDIVVLDPLTNLVSEDVNKINEVLTLLKPFKILARRHNIAIVAVWHLNKKKDILGSVGFQSLAKTILLLGRTDAGLTITQKKNAFASPLPSLKLRIDGGNISWLGVSDVDVGEDLNERDSIIREFLFSLADEKPTWSFTEITERAKREGLNIESVKVIGQRLVQKGMLKKHKIRANGRIATTVWEFNQINNGGGVNLVQSKHFQCFTPDEQSRKNIHEQRYSLKKSNYFNGLQEEEKSHNKKFVTVNLAQVIENKGFNPDEHPLSVNLVKGIIGDPYVEGEIRKLGEVKAPALDKFLSFLNFTAQRQREKLSIFGEEVFDLNWISEEVLV